MYARITYEGLIGARQGPLVIASSVKKELTIFLASLSLSLSLSLSHFLALSGPTCCTRKIYLDTVLLDTRAKKYCMVASEREREREGGREREGERDKQHQLFLNSCVAKKI